MNLGLSLSFPTFNALISIHADTKKLGEVMGVSESINSFSLAIFPILGAALYGHFGFPVYYFFAALPILAFFIAFSGYKQIGKTSLK